MEQIKKDEISNIINEYKLFKKNNMDILSLGDELDEAIYVINKNGLIVEINKKYEDVAGLKKEELIGLNMKDIWVEQIYNSEEKFIRLNNSKKKLPRMVTIAEKKSELTETVPRSVGLLVLEEKRKFSVITRIRRQNSTVIITGIPYFNEIGEIEYVVTVIRDASEFIDLKEKLDEFEYDKEIYINELKYLRKSQFSDDLVGSHEGLEKVKQYIQQVAKTDITVLITGETGAGKEVVAKEIYKNSLRNNGPYIKVNCAAIPENLLESELFGYEKGAFTGAQQKNKLGLFQMANHGTILLDEIGEMPLLLQSKLLRVIQDKEITRVGGTTPIKIDVRIIAATNQNLEGQIEKGAFRKDLYYRLNVFPIKVLPLRERKDDISTLIYYFLERANKRYNIDKIFGNEAIEEFELYNWPGNVRELENIIERLAVINNNKIITRREVATALGTDTFVSGAIEDNLTLKEAVRELEKNIIEKALKKYKTTYKAADALGVNQSTIVKKAKLLGIKKW